MKEETRYETATAVQEILSRFYIYIDKTTYDTQPITINDTVFHRTTITIARTNDIDSKYNFPFYYHPNFLMNTYNPFQSYVDLLGGYKEDVITLLDMLFMWYQWIIELDTRPTEEWAEQLYDSAEDDIDLLRDSMHNLFSDVELELLCEVFFK